MEKNLNDLYFGVMMRKMSFMSEYERSSLEQVNLFNIPRVKWSVARYVVMTPEERKELVRDPLSWCFMETWGKCEFEFIVCPWPYRDGETVEECGNKVDVFTMYVQPNAKLLMDMVNNVSVESAKQYLKSERRKMRK